ncbi:MAG: hypothetical protein SV186_04455 [Candidatus Nanohaloarchaea archaeon]|nr:hypothetical protein [Candidatus Nanohaloarchaea archaeon]
MDTIRPPISAERVLGAVGIVVLIFGLLFYTTSTQQIGKDEAADQVKQIFEAQGQTIEIVSVTSASGSLYQVVVSQQGQLNKIYVTKDGSFLIQNPVNITQATQTAAARQDFISCLSGRPIRIVGDSSRNATRAQIQILGGANAVQDIYVEMDNQTRQTLLQQGATRIPVTIYNGTIYQGVKTVGFYEQLTGCTYPYSNTSLR